MGMSVKKIYLSVIVPVYNEEKTVVRLLRKVLKYLPRNSEVVVVNDGSSDRTVKELNKFGRSKRVRVFNMNINRGKGYAVRHGLEQAQGQILLIQDADLEYDPKYYTKLLEPIGKGEVEVVYGSRLKGIPVNVDTLRTIPLPSHFVANRALSLMTNLMFGSNLTDMETCYKVFTKGVYKKLKLTKNKFDIEVEMTAQILQAGYKIVEVPIRTKPRLHTEGKKLTWRDGLGAVTALVEYKFLR